MKNLLFTVIVLAFGLPVHAQLVFRNAGKDTIRIAVGTFYDTSKKAMTSSEGKAITVKGWYRLYPGDSIMIGKFMGPAVYYRREIIRNDKYVIGDTMASKNAYREWLSIPKRDPNDSSKFSINHPIKNGDANRFQSGEFRVVIVPEESKRTGRLVIELGQRVKI